MGTQRKTGTEDETHSDLMGRNAFVITMLGVIAFCAASYFVMVT